MKRLLWFILPCLFLWACQQDTSGELKPLDLLEYGIPITIQAPDSAVVKSQDLGGIVQDVTVRGGKDYYIQIYASEAETNDYTKVKARQLAEVKGNIYFSKIVEEEERGFLYQTVIDSSNISYGFRYLYLQGDREYIFQTGLIGTFTEEEARAMYSAVKPAAK